MLWAHKAENEKKLIVAPDKEGRVRPGLNQKAVGIWAKATRLHFSLDLGFGSQPLAACLTEERCIGGRAWPNYILYENNNPKNNNQAKPPAPTEKMEWVYPVVLWSNTTLGLLIRWLHGSRQQIGRSITTISRLPELKVLDHRSLTEEQLATAQAIFEEFREKEFLPANEAYLDPTRIGLDEAVFVRMLAQPEEIMDWPEVIRDRWCREPTVHGGKSTQPR